MGSPSQLGSAMTHHPHVHMIVTGGGISPARRSSLSPVRWRMLGMPIDAHANSRLISADATGVTFKYKDYRIEGPDRYKAMTLEPGEFIRRFLMHVPRASIASATTACSPMGAPRALRRSPALAS
jgi:putative transposase